MATINSKENTTPEVSNTEDNVLLTPTDQGESSKPTSNSVDMGPVQAYAKLEGEKFCYYIRTLQVTLGRKVNKQGKVDKVDIPLGSTKSVSRQHARLFYNFTTQRFEMMVIGKNGAFVNEQFIERGITVPLENRTKIQIGEVHFIFLLPYADTEDANRDDPNNYLPSSLQLEKNKKRKSTQDTNTGGDDDEFDEIDEEMKKTMIGYPGVPNPYIGKEDKPPFSYANLIAQAINASTEKRMTLNEIYTYLSTTYPFFKKVSSTGWQNSVRHNLSLNKAFIKMPRSNNDSGKGAFWTIDPKLEHSIFATNIPIKQRNNKRSSASLGSSKESDDNTNITVDISSSSSSSASKRSKKEKSTVNINENDLIKDDQNITVEVTTASSTSTNTETITKTATESDLSTLKVSNRTKPLSSQSENESSTSFNTIPDSSQPITNDEKLSTASLGVDSKIDSNTTHSDENDNSDSLKSDNTVPVLTYSEKNVPTNNNEKNMTTLLASSSNTTTDDSASTNSATQASVANSYSNNNNDNDNDNININNDNDNGIDNNNNNDNSISNDQSTKTNNSNNTNDKNNNNSNNDNNIQTNKSNKSSKNNNSNTPTNNPPNVSAQAQLQLQLQNTIRQHLLDPIKNPLPPTIAQLLPQAIAQLPPQIANQLTTTLNAALRAQQQHQLQVQLQQQQASSSVSSSTKPTTITQESTSSTSSLSSTTSITPAPSALDPSITTIDNNNNLGTTEQLSENNNSNNNTNDSLLSPLTDTKSIDNVNIENE